MAHPRVRTWYRLRDQATANVILGRADDSFITVFTIVTEDTNPNIRGLYGFRNGQPPISIDVTISGQGPFAALFIGTNMWEVLGTDYTALAQGLHEIVAVATWPDGFVASDKSKTEVRIGDGQVIADSAMDWPDDQGIDWPGIVGGAEWPFSGSTTPPDDTPDQFWFSQITDVDPSTVYISNPITVAGVDDVTAPGSSNPLGIPMTISAGGEYSINGGLFTAVGQDVFLGDVITVRQTSSSSFSTLTGVNLDINGINDTFFLTTASVPQDTTPDAFTFTDVSAATLSTTYTDSMTVSGVNTPAPFEVIGGEWQLNGGSWTAGLVSPGTGPSQTTFNGDVITLRVTSSASYLSAASSTLDINGVSDTFTVTTDVAPAPDTTPDQFTFNDLIEVPISTLQTSQAITVLGINSPANLSIANGEHSINGGAWSTSATTVNLNDTVSVRHTSAASFATDVDTVLTIDIISDTFTSTTAANSSSATTPLATPGWVMDVEPFEEYPYTKMGVAYSLSDYRTLFSPDTGSGGTVTTVTNTAELNTALSQAKSDPNLQIINLNSGNYTWTKNSLANFNRGTTNCLVIRTTPGDPTQAIMTQIREERGTMHGVAFVDLEIKKGIVIQGNFSGTKSNTDILVERCHGWVIVQGSTNTSQPAPDNKGVTADNIIIRLNTLVDHWGSPGSNLTHGLFCSNTDGILLEGNLFDHNGWDPAFDRTLAESAGGPNIRKHNVYLSRPSDNVIARFNFSSRPSSHGLHFKGGAIAYRNIIARAPIGIQQGYGFDQLYNIYGIVQDPEYRNNLHINAADVRSNLARGMAHWLNAEDGFVMDSNYMLYDRTSPSNSATAWVEQNFPMQGVMSNNVAYQWNNNVSLRGSPNFTPNITYTNNNWNASAISAPAQALAYQLGADPTDANNDAWIDSYKVARRRLGVDIEELKGWMATIIGGITP